MQVCAKTVSIFLIFLIAFFTDFPRLSLVLSLSSKAAFDLVEMPEGPIALLILPVVVKMSTSMVGFHLDSNTWRPLINLMFDIRGTPFLIRIPFYITPLV